MLVYEGWQWCANRLCNVGSVMSFDCRRGSEPGLWSDSQEMAKLGLNPWTDDVKAPCALLAATLNLTTLSLSLSLTFVPIKKKRCIIGHYCILKMVSAQVRFSGVLRMKLLLVGWSGAIAQHAVIPEILSECQGQDLFFDHWHTGCVLLLRSYNKWKSIFT